MQLFTPKEYVKIAVANAFGLDKLRWNERIEWFNTHENQLHTLMDKADEPAMFLAACIAWEDICNHKPTGFAVSLDGVASGLQWLSVLSGDLLAAELCNVFNTGNREDAYTRIYEIMKEELDGELGVIERNDIKQAIMTSLYGSTQKPKEIFGEDTIQLYTFYAVMEKYAPKAWELNLLMLDIWDETRDRYDWILPDNFHAGFDVEVTVKETFIFNNTPYESFRTIKAPKKNGRALSANMTHSVESYTVREMLRRCTYDPKQIQRVWDIINGTALPHNILKSDNDMVAILWNHYKETNILSARIFDHLNNINVLTIDVEPIKELLLSLPAKPFPVMVVHDCFRIPIPFCNDIRIQYNRQLHEVAKSSLLQYVLKQIMQVDDLELDTYNEELVQATLNADYALS